MMNPDDLASTDVAQHALDALSHSSIREVVILARRGPRHAAFSVGEFLALGHLFGVDVIVDSDELEPQPDDDVETALKLDIAREFAARRAEPGNRRIVFRFLTSPVELVGDARVEGLRVMHGGGDTEVIETSLVLRSIGYLGSPIDGVPFDNAKGLVPNENGRVLGEDGRPIPGVYVTGWIKRGPRGVIGTNRTCAEQTVAQLWEDLDAGTLARDVSDRAELMETLAERGAYPVDWQGWRAIDLAERRRGVDAARPRRGRQIRDMLAAASGR